MEKASPENKTSPEKSQSNDKPKQPDKEDSMLLRFAQGKKYHRFSAERVGDHCLPTTISDLQLKYGIHFDRKRIRVPNRFGSLTTVNLYWLTGENLEIAKRRFGLNKQEVV